MQINDFAKQVHANNVEKGWWEEGVETRNKYEMIALVHTELSEAVEELRKGKPAYYEENGKPEGWGIELADAVIRIFDILEANRVDADYLLYIKHKYNQTRPYRHGGKLA